MHMPKTSKSIIEQPHYNQYQSVIQHTHTQTQKQKNTLQDFQRVPPKMFLYTLTSAAFLQAIIKEHTKSAPDQSKPTHLTWVARWEQCDGRQHDGWINMSFWFWWVQLTIGGQQNLVNYGNVLSFVPIANWWVHSDSINPVSLKAIAAKYLEKHKAKQGVYVERMLTHHFAAVWIIKKNHQLKCSFPPKICEVGCRYSLLCLLKHLPTGLLAVPRLQVWALPNRLRACRGPIKNHQNLRICSIKHLWDSNRVLWGNNIVAYPQAISGSAHSHPCNPMSQSCAPCAPWL